MRVSEDVAEKIANEIVCGNPGALRVVIELQYFSKWTKILETAKKHGYVGGKLWELYKDKFGHSMMDTGNFLLDLMRKDEEELRKKAESKKPICPPMRGFWI